MWGYVRQNLIQHVRANAVAYFFTILIFLIGVVLGALSVKILPADQKAELAGYLQIFFNGLGSGQGDAAGLLGTVMFHNAKVIGLMWLLGFTIVGIPFVLFILFTRGFIIGFTVGFLVNEYIVKGLLFALAAVLPHNFLVIPAVFITSVAATNFSLMLLKRKGHGNSNLLYASFAYSCLCLIMVIVMLLAALVEVYISPVFMKMIVNMFLNG